MTAHDPTGKAHDSERPGANRPTMINVDSSGVSMSWKTAVTVIGFVVVVMLTWNTFSATLARSSDLKAHNEAKDAHEEHPKHADRIHRAEVVEMVEPIKEKVERTEERVITVQNGFYEQRAEDLAYRAVEQMPKTTPARQRIRRFEQVKRKAKTNLKEGKDIREGIDAPVF
jgi:hypothetical protein